jgi:hypothetical protein
MTTITFVKKEITYLLLALNQYQSKLREEMGDEMGDEYDDLLMAQHLIKRIKEAEDGVAGKSN